MLGVALIIACTTVIAFMFFGKLLQVCGGGEFFTDISSAAFGRYRGGSGKVEVVASALFGTVSGSAVANVMSTGIITIPNMKKAGYAPTTAGAIEAVSYTGGQIMPPVMGAAAFVMAEFLAVPYAQVALWALIPAILYYVAVFFAVHFEAKRYGLLGVPKAQLPRLGRVMAERGHLFFPILIVLVGLVLGYSAPLCALIATLACLPTALLRKTTREGITWRTPLAALEEGAKNTLSVAIACALAGIIIGATTITGLGIVFTQVVLELALSSLVLALVLTAIAGLVLGLGLPTTPSYILMVALLVPALVKLGAPIPAAHMFAF